eukprot:7192729-Lingulodinium_polyedra.AAC.1
MIRGVGSLLFRAREAGVLLSATITWMCGWESAGHGFPRCHQEACLPVWGGELRAANSARWH